MIMKNLEYSEYDSTYDNPEDKIIVDLGDDNSTKNYFDQRMRQSELLSTSALYIPKEIQTCFGNIQETENYLSEMDENKKNQIKQFNKSPLVPNRNILNAEVLKHILTDEYCCDNELKKRSLMFDKKRLEDKKRENEPASIDRIMTWCNFRIEQIDNEIKKIKKQMKLERQHQQ